MLALLLTSTSAHAFEVMTKEDGTEMSWPSFPLEWRMNASNALGLDENMASVATQRAGSAWEDDGAATAMSFQGTTTNAISAHDKLNTVYFTDDWPWDTSLMAMTSSFSDSEGNFVGFDIAVNTRDHEWAMDGREDAIDLQNTLTHEWGHALGLGHSLSDDLATMHASASPGETFKRDLSQDDVDGLFYLYTAGGAPPSVGCQSSPNKTSTLAWMGALATGLLLRRRREGARPCF